MELGGLISMPNNEIVRISVKNIKIDMVLAEDAVTPNGQLLIPAGTLITDKHIFRMNLYQILSVVIHVPQGEELEDDSTMILEDNATNRKKPSDLTPSEERLYNSESFRRFLNVFENVEKMVQDEFTNICDNQEINEKSLLMTTETLMNSVRLKSELFTYMNNLRTDSLHTFVHSVNVSVLCNIFGKWLKYSPEEVNHLTLAGLIHDIGKTKIDEELLSKKGRLSNKELEQVREHAQKGYEAIRHLNLPETVKSAVLLHHERNDGSGYPLGLKGEQIPDFAKIVAIVDVYDAMTSRRAYHKKFSPFRVIQLFEQESFGYLDTKFLFIFLENIAHYYLGEEVLLSDGSRGKIVFIHNQSPSRPIIQSGSDMIDLLTETKLSIVEVL